MTTTFDHRPAHPCIARRCGHDPTTHTRTPELESSGETVLWCAACRRHEVRAAWRGWFGRRARFEPVLAAPLRLN